MTQTSSKKRLSKEQWQALISEQQDGSLTQAEFCRTKGICLATFSNWKRKLSDNHKLINPEQPDFIELPVVSESLTRQTWDIELELPGNVILRMRQ